MAFKATLLANILAAIATHAWMKTYDPVPLGVVVTALLTVPLISTFIANFINPSSSMFSLVLAYPSFYFALTASICAYRLSPFHPLAKFPGPIMLKLTKLPSTWIAFKGKNHVYVKDLHDRYGPIIRTGPNELSTIDKELIPQILGNQGMPRGPQWEARSFGSGESNGLDSLISSRYTAVHAELRVQWNKAFSAEALRNYEELLIPRLVEFNNHLKKACGKGTAQLNIANWISRFTYDFMGDWVFSENFKTMENGDKEGRIEMMDKSMHLMSIIQQIPWIAPSVRSFPILNKWIVKFVSYNIQDSTIRSQKEMKRKDLFYYMGEAAGRSGSDFDVIAENCNLASIAASDTTASILSNAVYSLLSNPEKYKKLQQEVDKTFTEHEINSFHLSTGEEVDGKMYGEILGSMKYLNAVLNETMRLYPVIPTGLHRAPEPGSSSKTLRIGNDIILLPEGNSVNVSLYALHRDSRNFSPHPDAFIPERWLSSSEKSEYVTSKDMFIPFSMGPANCAGRTLALVELRYTLSFLVRNFNMEFDTPNYDPARWVQDLRDQYVLQKGGLHLRMSLRGEQ
ncbi:cytochrome P450 [Gymnopilus junonius]|uniref:Cytochrome P450 n=1 Tax=Gymnopilus junonius TaxID=109634 RepID=A0A9P5NNM1_GYMJU|nr:cytochrome P450 [Gymnopilus junonius]